MALLLVYMVTQPIRWELIFKDPSFEGNHLSQGQKDFNKSMKAVRVSVEWVFKEIIRYFAFMDFKKPPEDTT